MNLSPPLLDALVIAAHPDDAELGAGGAILSLLAAGRRVGILDLTNGEPTPHGSVAIRERETNAATAELGITWRGNLNLPNRSLQPTLEARAALASVFRLAKPRWLFAPYWVDAHPDHTAAAELVDAARFWSKLSNTDLLGEPHHPERIYNYFSVHLKMTPQPTFILDISEHWEKKQAAIRCYESQFITGRESDPPSLSFLERFRDEAAWWGKAIGAAYGEPFACREPLGLSGLSELV